MQLLGFWAEKTPDLLLAQLASSYGRWERADWSRLSDWEEVVFGGGGGLEKKKFVCWLGRGVEGAVLEEGKL